MTTLKTRFHKDGTVAYWDVYQQQWQRHSPEHISNEVLASLNEAERNRILALRGENSLARWQRSGFYK